MGSSAGAQSELETRSWLDLTGVDALDHLDEPRIVNRTDLVFGGGAVAHLVDVRQVEEPELTDAVVGKKDALGTQRVGRAEVIRLGDVIDGNESDRIGHGDES